MKKISFAASVTFLMGAVTAFTAFAQAKPEVLVKQRQAAMTLQGKYFGPMGAMAQGKAPFNASIVARNAPYLEALSKMPWDGFDPSTENVPSNALPAVFKEPAKFKESQDQLQSAVGKLVTASKGTDEGAIKAAIGAVGKSCAGCHDNFRKKE